MTIIPSAYPTLLFFLHPNLALKSDVNDELLVKGLTALTISSRGSRSKLVTNARVPEPEPSQGASTSFWLTPSEWQG